MLFPIIDIPSYTIDYTIDYPIFSVTLAKFLGPAILPPPIPLSYLRGGIEILSAASL